MSTVSNPVDALYNIVEENVNAANAIATEAKSALGNSAKMVKDYREDPETADERVAKFQKVVEAAQAKINSMTEEINAYIREVLKTDTWSEEVTEAKKNEYNAHKGTAREAFKAITKMAELLGQETPDFPELLSFTGAASKAGTGTGTKRPRFDRVEVNGEVVKTLTNVSQKIKSQSGASVSAADLQQAILDAAKRTDFEGFSGDVSFQWTETDKDKVTHTFDVTVYKAAADNSVAEDEDDSDDDDE